MVVLAWRPAAEWASDAWAGGVEAFLLLRFQNQGRFVVRQAAHAQLLCLNLTLCDFANGAEAQGLRSVSSENAFSRNQN
jgi:hypothetical protein